MRWTVVVLVASCVAARGASAAPVATVVNGAGAAESLCQFPDDGMTLTVSDAGKEVARHYFCSSYGKASAEVVTDARGTSYVLLKSGEGRGPNMTNQYLSVFRIAKTLVEYLRTPLSMGAGETSRWTYDYKVSRPPTGGILLTLGLHVDGTGASYVPTERTRLINVLPSESGVQADVLEGHVQCPGAFTQKDMEDCLLRELAAADRALTDTFAHFLALRSATQRPLLEKAEQAWETYREAECRESEAAYEGGTMEGVAYVGCKLELTRARREELERTHGEPPFPATTLPR